MASTSRRRPFAPRRGPSPCASWRTRRRTASRACTPRVLSSRTRTTEASCSSCSRREATASSARAPRLPSPRAPPGASRFPRNSASTCTSRRTRPLRSRRSSLRARPPRTCSTSSWRSGSCAGGGPRRRGAGGATRTTTKMTKTTTPTSIPTPTPSRLFRAANASSTASPSARLCGIACVTAGSPRASCCVSKPWTRAIRTPRTCCARALRA
mmetsp:Transcript_6406/g.25982  ORF Transcript_6406/g.25982 Transcript_6406/m.25982 type:complete len:212 (+) Transcript_6406:151-786(+)